MKAFVRELCSWKKHLKTFLVHEKFQNETVGERKFHHCIVLCWQNKWHRLNLRPFRRILNKCCFLKPRIMIQYWIIIQNPIKRATYFLVTTMFNKSSAQISNFLRMYNIIFPLQTLINQIFTELVITYMGRYLTLGWWF